MTEGELLARIAQTLKQEVGPAIDAEYPKTQAFMAAVVLQKLSVQVALARTHEQAEAADFDALITDLESLLIGRKGPGGVQQASADLARSRDPAALCRFIEALYAARAVLGEAHFGQLLGRVRQTLRANIERRVEYAA